MMENAGMEAAREFAEKQQEPQIKTVEQIVAKGFSQEEAENLYGDLHGIKNIWLALENEGHEGH
ncbi:MAG: hypothetical protein M3Q64_00335 [bacterium]|nr:hypothetical protein [bacterium]